MNNKRILIAEDEPAYRMLLQTIFSKENYTVLAVTNGQELLNTVSQFNPDLILLDLIMPQKNGFQVLVELKQHDSLKNIRVIVLSNLGQDEDIEKAKELGAIDFIIKSDEPFYDVVNKVKKYLQKEVSQ